MTRLPDLEAELVAAARRRYAPSRRRRLGLPGLRLLVPAMAALVVAFGAATALRGQDPEIEAPAGTPSPPAHTRLQDLVATPLGAAGQELATPGERPVTMTVKDARGTRWHVVAYAAPYGNTCLVATSFLGGAGCLTTGTLRHDLEKRDPPWELDADVDSRIVWGLVGIDAERVQVSLGSASRRAQLHERVFVTRVTEEERRTNEFDGKPPEPGPVKARLFAVAFTDEEVPGDPDATPATLRVTYEDGKTVDSVLPRPSSSDKPAGCYPEADLDAVMEIPGGEGSPVEVCRRFWRETGFPGRREPDRLTVCEGPGDAAPLVFPGGPDVCARLGLDPYR